MKSIRCASIMLFLLLLPSLPLQAQETSPPPVVVGAAADDDLKTRGDILNINMDDVELKEFIRTMSTLLGRNFVISAKLRGKVTIISPKPVSSDIGLSLMESVLDVYGYKIVSAGAIYKVIEKVDTKSEGLTTEIGLDIDRRMSGDRMITQILPIQYISASEVMVMFHPLVSKDGHLVAHDGSNTLILTDNVSNVNRLKKILQQLDVKGSKSQLYHFRLQHASAEELVKQLSPLFQRSVPGAQMAPSTQQQRKGLPFTTVTGSSLGENTLLVADVRTNTVLASCTPEAFVQLSHLVNILDIASPRVRDRIHVYYLKNAVAEEVAEVLKKQVVQPQTAVQSPMKPRRDTIEEPMLENVNINADKSTNSLVITASPEDFEIVSEVIRKLDIRRSQVLVEALIVEASLDKTQELGVEWRNADAPDPTKYKLFGGTNLPVGTQATGALNQTASDANPYSANNPAGLVLGAIKGPIYWGKTAFYSIGALARALQADTEVNILLTPHIVTYDNEESEIIVGEERPYLKSSQTSTEGSVIRTFEFKDVGTTMRLTPHISQASSIRLDIFTEIKNFVEQVDIGAITTTKRQIKTSVQVDDGDAVVLGGIIKEDKRGSTSMVPCLGQIWGLGWLFKSKRGQNQKTNLLIFISPHIIDSGDDHLKMTEKKKNEYQEQSNTDELDRELFKMGDRQDDPVTGTFDVIEETEDQSSTSIPADDSRLTGVGVPGPVVAPLEIYAPLPEEDVEIHVDTSPGQVPPDLADEPLPESEGLEEPER